MEAAHVAAMVMEVEEDDDVFFADLKRQISLLITEDVEDDHYYYSYPSPSASSLSIHQIQQAFSRQPQYQLDHHHHHHHDPHHISTYKTSTITDHQQSKGTGVFIPNSSPQFNKRRNNKHQSYKVTNYYYNNSYNNNKKKYKLSSSYRQQIMQVPSQEGVFAQVRTSSQMHIVNQH